MEENSHISYSRAWLESLSTGELSKLAEDTGIDIPVGLERIFIIEELLLESSNTEKENGENGLKINPSYTEPVALPKQYNISFIEVIIRDPLWVFVHWEVKGHDREANENAGDFAGYCLRVYPLNEGETVPKSKENSFTIQLDVNDSGRYIGFAEHSPQDSGSYIIKLCAIRGDTELQLAVSQQFKLPRLVEDDSFNEFSQKPLVRLSGAMNFTTVKSIDRQSRIKGQ